MPRPLENINFPKVITILACIFGISLGLCGLTAYLNMSGSQHGMGGLLASLGILELIAILLSAFGLVIMTILWVISSAMGGYGKRPDPQKLFDDSDKEER